MSGSEPVHVFLRCVPPCFLPLPVFSCLHIDLKRMHLPPFVVMVQSPLFFYSFDFPCFRLAWVLSYKLQGR